MAVGGGVVEEGGGEGRCSGGIGDGGRGATEEILCLSFSSPPFVLIKWTKLLETIKRTVGMELIQIGRWTMRIKMGKESDDDCLMEVIEAVRLT